MKRPLGPSIIIVVLLIFFNKIDGNHKDTVICQKYWEVEKGPHLGQAHGNLKKAIFHVKKKKRNWPVELRCSHKSS